jgi:hypothetical protein
MKAGHGRAHAQLGLGGATQRDRQSRWAAGGLDVCATVGMDVEGEEEEEEHEHRADHFST